MAGLLSVAAAACGDDDDDAATTTTAGGGETTTSAADDAAAEWEQVEADANEEGKVVLYTVLFETDVQLLEPAFEQAYPDIDFQYFRGNTGEVTSRLTTERGTGNTADVVIVNLDAEPSTVQTFDADGLLAPLVGPVWEEEDVAHTVVENRFFAYATIFGWAWNTQIYPDGIDDWEDFLDPELKGKVGAFDPTQSSIIPACYENQVEATSPTWLEDFAAQEPRIYPGGTAQEQALAAGEIGATPWSSKRILLAKEQGAPVEYAIPPGSVCVPALEGAVLDEAPNPNAAQVFVNWYMSEEAQAILTGTGYATRSNVPGSDIDFADLEPTVPASPEEHQAFIAEFDSLFR
jgi:iron(III) transport system substrate-binding protein